MDLELSREHALVFRLTHISNVPTILTNGLHCGNSPDADPRFHSIGNADVIARRARRAVPAPPHGALGDYVPFYFTPWSVMLLNILTGRGVPRVAKTDLAIVTSSVSRLRDAGVRVLFTDRHAGMRSAGFFERPEDLGRIDWDILRRRDFRTDADDPGKRERYQAEALAFRHVPVAALMGVACYDTEAVSALTVLMRSAPSGVPIRARREWYFA
ncbi:MAG: DUF4433 domain-containing protein [Armatimonadetes bacterium]|nr:DUF4433 domain-containing protein [Armatimonadota bacterium]